jgi:thioredoxin-dependent peroxiredoxin
MPLQLGDAAPDFRADTTEGVITFHEWLGNHWGILFSHPRDFTPVCTTELGELGRLKPEFERRHTKVISLSVDRVEDHRAWMRDIRDVTGVTPTFPMIGDADRRISLLYGMIHPSASDSMTVRSVFVIGPDKRIKLTATYPASTGRNFDELLRVLDSLQLTATYQVATPVNWTAGEDVIIASAVTDADARQRYPQGWRAPKPYLRYVPAPSTRRAATTT